MKRQLDDVERKLTATNVARLRDEKKYIEIEKRHLAFILDEGIQLEMHNRLMGVKKRQRELEANEKEIDFTLRVSEMQLREGVEIKEGKK